MLRRKSLCLCVLSLLLTSGLVTAKETDSYLIRNWTTGDGLPENTVRAIVEAHDGYLWIGTANGLARFDGVRFTTYNSVNTPALFCDDIFAMFEDRGGALWIATQRGLLRYINGQFQTITLGPVGSSVFVYNFAEDSAGTLWLACRAGLARWDADRFRIVLTPADGPQWPICIQAAQEGGLWVAGGNGLWRFREGQLERLVASPTPQLLVTTRDGKLWGLEDRHRLYLLRDRAWSLVRDFAENRCGTLYAAPDGDLWIGAASRNRAYRFRDDRFTEIGEREALEGNRAICFAEDRDGNLWLGMNGAGLYRLRERRIRLFDRQNGLQALSLTSLCQDLTGELMVNVMGWTLHRFTNGCFEPVAVAADGTPFELPTALLPARGGGVWAGTYYGALSRVRNGSVVERIGAEAGTRALFSDRDGGVWRGTRTAGVEYFSGTNVARFSTAQGLSFDDVYCFAQEPRGAMWVGTAEGLNRIQQGHIARFTTTNGLGHNFVSALCTDSEGTVWAGTLGGGLSAWNGSRFITLSTAQGLANNTVTQLLEDDHKNLWIGTRAGLMRVGLAQLHGFLAGTVPVVTGTLVGPNEGLIRPNCWTEYQPAAIKARDGTLWFCTGSGVVAIDPKDFAQSAPPPVVHVEMVSVDGGTQTDVLQRREEVKIAPGTQRITIHFTGISPSASELIRFRYRLHGYDRDWIDAGQDRSAAYSQVSPGHYEFQVIAANNDGVWNNTGDRLMLYFEPAFWQTKGFYGLLLLLFLGTGPAFYFWRVRRLEKRQAVQEEFSRKLIRSQEHERKRIAAELHDSLGQNLLVIKNRAALALTQADQPVKMAAHLNEVSAMASAAIHEVRDIAQNLRPFQLDELGLTKAIASMARKMGDASPIELESHLDDVDGALPVEFEIHFYRVVQECLNNILKHSQASRATIDLRREAKQLRLTITDNGRGFALDQPNKPLGFGQHSIAERVRAMGGRVNFDSRPGEGTRVEIELPARRPVS